MSLQRLREYLDETGPTALALRSIEEAESRTRNYISMLPGINNLCYRASLEELRGIQAKEEALRDILHTTRSFRGHGLYSGIEPQQIMSEFDELLELVNEHRPARVVEIGTAEGGTFYGWNRLDSTQTVVSIDLPGGIHGGGYPEQRVPFYDAFDENVETIFLRADSQLESTKKQVQESMTKEIDFLWIDGDHRYQGVKRDFELYSELVAEDGMIALHDIVEHPYHPHCEVDRLWEELTTEYKTREIISDPDRQTWGGIGVVWP